MDKDSKMTVIVVEPGLRPYLKDIQPGLKSLQREVGGNIEASCLEDGVFVISDVSAKNSGKEFNRILKTDDNKYIGSVYGTFLLVGMERERFSTLPKPLMKKYVFRFWMPQRYIEIGDTRGFIDDDSRIHSKPSVFMKMDDILARIDSDNENKIGGRMTVTNEQLNHKLYEKMAAEQLAYYGWLLQQPPKEILNHAYEYSVREDIVNVASYIDLPDDQARALLSSPSPLGDVYSAFDKSDITLGDTIRECFEDRAHTLIKQQKEEIRQTPVYLHSGPYAREHGELDAYRKSNQVNEMCRDAIDKSIGEHYDGSYLGNQAAREVVEQFGFDRTLYILANTVNHKDWDLRFSRGNREWAASHPAFNLPDGPDPNKTTFYVCNAHSALLDLFLSQTRKDFLLTQPLTPPDIEAEAKRLLSQLQALPELNSPSGTHFIAEMSPSFMARAGTQDVDALSKLLPFKSLTISQLNDRKGIYAMIAADEERDKPLRRPSVRSKLDKTDTPTKPKAPKKKKEMEL